METIFLNLHLAGATLTVVILVLSIRRLLSKGNGNFYPRVIVGITLWQVGSGVGMLATIPNVNITHLCVSGIAYLAIVGGVRYLLIKQQRAIRTI